MMLRICNLLWVSGMRLLQCLCGLTILAAFAAASAQAEPFCDSVADVFANLQSEEMRGSSVPDSGYWEATRVLPGMGECGIAVDIDAQQFYFCDLPGNYGRESAETEMERLLASLLACAPGAEADRLVDDQELPMVILPLNEAREAMLTMTAVPGREELFTVTITLSE